MGWTQAPAGTHFVTHPDPEFSSEPLSDMLFTDEKIGDYLLLRRLGRGGMADVYLAQQESLNRSVALKVLKKEFAVDESYVRRFKKEAQAAAALVHPNIIQVFEVNQAGDKHYIAQEYVHGQNLKQVIDRDGAFSLVLAVNIIRQVALALSKAAENKITHRDIKPDNIMLTADGQAKVADFGLARIELDESLTKAGMTMGTPLYMSPEQIESNDVDIRSDIYSLGITFYHMLSGNPPFQAESVMQIAWQHVNESAPQLSTIRADIPDSVDEIIKKMMAKKPDDRYQNCAQLSRDLLSVELPLEQGDWDQALNQMTVEEAQRIYSKASTDTTGELQIALEKNRNSFQSQVAFQWIALFAILSSLLIGVVWANAKRPRNYLDIPESTVQVNQQKDVVAQFELAELKNDQEHWMAVERFFPAYDSRINRHWTNLSKLRLGEYYLIQKKPQKAIETFEQLAQLNEKSDEFFHVNGLAGLVAGYKALENQSRATALMGKIGARQELVHDRLAPFLAAE